MLLGAAVFGAMAMLVTAGQVEEEALVLRWIEDRRSPWWTFAMVAITRFGTGPVTATLTALLCVWLLVREQRRDAAFLATVNLGSVILNTAFKSLFERQRPPDEIVTSVMDLQTFSFPSGHALSAMVFYASVSIVGARLGGAGLRALLLAAAALMIPTMGFTRVYLGVHYPTDVIAGWGLGAAWVSVAYLIFYATGIRR
jgi:undecaprenyl-diphosphatase